MKSAFVTGGADFLGLNLIGGLAADGWKVLAFDQNHARAAYLDRLGAHVVVGDITDVASVERAIPDDLDAVFHLAASTSHWSLGDAEQTRINVGGTRSVVTAALQRSVRRFIHTSSIAAYGFHPGRITEDCPSTALDSPINYFRTKRLAEIEIHRGIEQGLDAVILNPSNIIGAFDYGGWSRFFTLIDTGRLPGIPPGKGSFCHAREVAMAHIAAFERGTPGHNYLLGGADATFLEVVQHVGGLLDRSVPSRPTPAFLSKAAARVSLWISYLTRTEPDLTPEKATLLSGELLCSSEKAQRELGYEPVPLETMLADCHRWMVAEGMLRA